MTQAAVEALCSVVVSYHALIGGYMKYYVVSYTSMSHIQNSMSHTRASTPLSKKTHKGHGDSRIEVRELVSYCLVWFCYVVV